MSVPVPLRQFCHARARATGSALAIALALRDPDDWHLVREGASLARVRAWMGALRAPSAARVELPGLASLHFCFDLAAGAGRAHDLAADPLGRAFAQRLLDMPIPVAAKSILKAGDTMQSATVQEIAPLDAKNLLDKGAAVLIDVREAEEYAALRIPGSTLVPLSGFDPAAQAHLAGKHVIVHCQMGGRSMRAATALAPILGAANVVSLQGGLAAWHAAGLPTAGG